MSRQTKMAIAALLTGTVLTFLLATFANAAPVVVEFTKPGCPFCEAIAPAVARLQREGFDIVIVGGQRARDLAADYGVATVPAFLTIEPGAEPGSDSITGRKSGGMTEAELRTFLKSKGVTAKPLSTKGR
jgi:thiol-disulfide isomerase/thioredoxin